MFPTVQIYYSQPLGFVCFPCSLRCWLCFAYAICCSSFLFPSVSFSLCPPFQATLTAMCLERYLGPFSCTVQHCQLPVLQNPEFLLTSTKTYETALKYKLFLVSWKVSSPTLGPCSFIEKCMYVFSFFPKVRFSYLNTGNFCKRRTLVTVCIFFL